MLDPKSFRPLAPTGIYPRSQRSQSGSAGNTETIPRKVFLGFNVFQEQGDRTARRQMHPHAGPLTREKSLHVAGIPCELQMGERRLAAIHK